MTSARAVRAGRAGVEMTLNKTAFEAGIKSAENSIRNFGFQTTKVGASIAAAGAAITAPFVASLKVFADYGDRLDKLAARTNVSVEALSSLEFGATRTGASLKDVEVGFRSLNRTLLNAAQGSKASIDALAGIGLTFEDLQKLSPEDQLFAIADGIQAISSSSTARGIAQQILGRSGSNLFPLLKEGAQGMRELATEADRLGVILSTGSATAAAELTDDLSDVRGQIRGISASVGGALQPAASNLLETIQPLLAGVIKFAEENPRLITSVVALGVALAGVGSILAVVGGSAIALAAAIGLVGGPITAAVVGFGLLTAAAAAAFGFAVTDTAMERQLVKIQDGIDKTIQRIRELKDEAKGLASDADFSNFGTAQRESTRNELKAELDSLDAQREQIEGYLREFRKRENAALAEVRTQQEAIDSGGFLEDVIGRISAGDSIDRLNQAREGIRRTEEQLAQLTEASAGVEDSIGSLDNIDLQFDSVVDGLQRGAEAGAEFNEQIAAQRDVLRSIGRFAGSASENAEDAIRTEAAGLLSAANELGILDDNLRNMIGDAVSSKLAAPRRELIADLERQSFLARARATGSQLVSDVADLQTRFVDSLADASRAGVAPWRILPFYAEQFRAIISGAGEDVAESLDFSSFSSSFSQIGGSGVTQLAASVGGANETQLSRDRNRLLRQIANNTAQKATF